MESGRRQTTNEVIGVPSFIVRRTSIYSEKVVVNASDGEQARLNAAANDIEDVIDIDFHEVLEQDSDQWDVIEIS